jgi:hypothetical protein
MDTLAKDKVSGPVPPAAVPKAPAALPDIEIRFSPLYAWLLIGFCGLFFFSGLFFLSPQAPGRIVRLGIFICVVSIAGIFGGNYWRTHLPVVVRMTSRHLLLPRAGLVNWTDIVAIEKRSLPLSRYGTRNSSAYVCFKLKNQPSKHKRLNESLLTLLKGAVMGGYDVVINPQNELLRDADWFLLECKKRMPAPTAPPNLPTNH